GLRLKRRAGSLSAERPALQGCYSGLARRRRIGSMAGARGIQFRRLIFIIARELAKGPHLVGPAILRSGRPALLRLLAEII
ncbi:MAG: hypothetical protein M3N39_06110, partial [Pseudomonadota bacterium]|nr:hypothetical protein [Pseudomonadota bacterium]